MSQKFKPTMIAAALTAALSGGAIAQYVIPSSVNGTSTNYGTTAIMDTTVIDVGKLSTSNPGHAGGTGQYYGTLTQAQETDGSGSNLLVSGEGATVITGWSDGGARTVSLVVNGNAAAGYGSSIVGGLTVNGTVIHDVATGSAGTDAVNVNQLNSTIGTAIAGIPLQTSLDTGAGATISGNTVAAINGKFTTINSGATSTNSLAVTNNATVGGTLGVTGLSTLGAVTQVGTANINATGTNTTNIGTAGGATNIGNASSTNTILGTTSVTGITTINTTGSAATTIGASSNTSAVSLTSGASSIVTSNGTNNIKGVTNINASTNAATNINTGTSTSVVTIGSTGSYATNTVNAYSGNTTMSLANNTASLTAGTSLATNGTSGTTSGIGSGGLTVYNSALTIANGTTIPTASSPNGILAGNTYQNKINGNLLVDGNVYINGTLNYVSSNSANTSVVGSTAAGTGGSILSGANTATSGGTAIVLKGATGTQTVADANGKLTNVTGAATQSSASLTLTNGIGNTHGVVITETQATLSGGTHSSSLTMNDNGATFSNSATGAPVQVHGVNDGTSDFDAVNVRQFSGAIASVTAMANIPQVDQDKTYAVGVGMGSFMGKTALAAGVTYRFTRNGVFKGSVSSAMGGSNTTTLGVGAAWSY